METSNGSGKSARCDATNASAPEADLARRWDAAAKEAGEQPAQLSTAWLLAQPGVTGVIIGAERLESLQLSCDAVDLELSADLVERLGAVTAETPASA